MKQYRDESKPPYNALFWCNERKKFFRWNEFINYKL